MRKIDKRRRPREASQPVATQARLWHRWWLAAILGLVFVAYSNSFHGTLIFDNSSVIGEDTRIREATPENIESILHGGYWRFANDSGLYRPVTTFSYLLNYAVLGDGPNTTGYHVVNLALHEVNVVLVYALGMLIFGEAAPALALAAIWGLHPVLTESVSNIVGRADLLAAFGVLAGLLCHARAGRGRIVWLVGLVVAQTVGLFSKESAAVLPGIMLLYDLTWSERSTWRQRAPGYAAVAVVFAAFFYLRIGSQTHLVVNPSENPLVSAGFWTARLTAVKVIGKYLWLFFWPAHLTADYSFNGVPLFGWQASTWENVKAFLALAVCVGAVVSAILLWRRSSIPEGKPLFFFLVFFFVALSPVSNVIILIGAIMAERFLYLPTVGLAGCAVAGIYMLGQCWVKRPAAVRLAWAALGLVYLGFAGRTYARNFDWEDNLSLWSSAVKACPESARPHNNLGTSLSEMPGRLPEAIAEFQTALRIEPNLGIAHYNLGKAFAQMPGRLPETIAEYQAAIRIRPGYAEAHNNLGTALAHTPGRLPEAIAEYQAAVRIEPDFVGARINLGNALAQTPGRRSEAIAEYEAALRIKPDPRVQQMLNRLRAGR